MFSRPAYVQKNNKESSANGLKIQLVGLTKTEAVDSRFNREEESYKETNVFLSFDVQLASFGGKAASGVHSFPFAIMLPVDLPPSLLVWLDEGIDFPFDDVYYGIPPTVPFCLTRFAPWCCAVAADCLSQEGKIGGSCLIQYTFTAHLDRPGLLNSDAKESSLLTVLGAPQQAGAAVPVLVEPVTQPLTSCCFFNTGRSTSLRGAGCFRASFFWAWGEQEQSSRQQAVVCVSM